MTAGVFRAARRTRGAVIVWVRPVGYGLVLGLLGVLAQWAGVWSLLARSAASLHQIVGPVWIPMLAVALRVLWLAARALGTRLGHGTPGRPVRPELRKLAPLFTLLGLVGTAWALDVRFDAFRVDLGTALASTIVGLALHGATLLIAAYSPAWSLARVTSSREREQYTFDGATLGEGEPGMRSLLETIAARKPEALHVDIDRWLPIERRRLLHERIWRGIDGSIPLNPPRSRDIAP